MEEQFELAAVRFWDTGYVILRAIYECSWKKRLGLLFLKRLWAWWMDENTIKGVYLRRAQKKPVVYSRSLFRISAPRAVWSPGGYRVLEKCGTSLWPLGSPASNTTTSSPTSPRTQHNKILRQMLNQNGWRRKILWNLDPSGGKQK